MMYASDPTKSKLHYASGYYLGLPDGGIYIKGSTPPEIRERLEKDWAEYQAEKAKKEAKGDFSPFFW